MASELASTVARSVVAPPAKFALDPYYTKFIYAREFPVVGSDRVSDKALLKANDTVRKTFAYRHDVLKAMINDGPRLVVLAPAERLTDLPELRRSKRSTAADEVRCLDYAPGLKLMVVPEENVLRGADDPLGRSSSVVAAFVRAMHAVTANRPVEPEFDRRPQNQ